MIVQRKAASPRILGVAALTREDLAELQSQKTTSVVNKLNDTHRQMARLIYSGKSNEDIAYLLGYSPARVATLRSDPLMKDRVDKMHAATDAEIVLESVDQMAEIARLERLNTIMAQRQINDQLVKADESGEEVPLRHLIAIKSDGLDRIGYGKKSTQVNMNVDFAAHLEAARRRVAPVIDVAASGDEAA